MCPSVRVRNAPTISSSPGRDTVHVGLHHHRVQGLIDPPARLEDRREERALAQLRDSQFHVTGLRGQHPRSGTVAIGHPSVAAFITGSADPFSGFELAEFLQHQTDGITDQVDAITSAERVEQLGQGRLWQGHRRDLLRCVLGGTHRRSRRRPLPHRSHSATTPKPTTLRDAYRRRGTTFGIADRHQEVSAIRSRKWARRRGSP